MSAAARYAYVHGRVSGMTNKLLKRADLGAMLALPIDKEQDILSRIGLPAISPGQVGRAPPSLEQRCITVLLEEMEVLVRAVAGNARIFFMYWAYRFELSNLKTILRGKIIGLSPAAIRAHLVEMGPLARLPIEKLLSTEDVTELLWQLDGTPFHGIALHARRIYEERHDLFALDAAVDRRYFARLSSLASQVEDGKGGALHVLVGDIIDRLNILWLLRYRFTYGLAPADTYYLLIPASYWISRGDLARLSQLGSLEDVIAQLPMPYQNLLAGVTDITEATTRLERMAWHRAEAILHSSAFSDGRTFAYLILRERDLFQVRALVTGKNMNLDVALVRMAAQFDN
ncbi:MAG: V-type ATPase subunit [Acidiferrobacter sp.]